MRVQMGDGRVLKGTAREIVEVMHLLSFGQEDRTLSQYIDWVVGQTRSLCEFDLRVTGEYDDAGAASLLRGIVDAGLATRL